MRDVVVNPHAMTGDRADDVTFFFCAVSIGFSITFGGSDSSFDSFFSAVTERAMREKTTSNRISFIIFGGRVDAD